MSQYIKPVLSQTHAFYWSHYDNYFHQSCSIPQEIVSLYILIRCSADFEEHIKSMYLDEAGGVSPIIDLDRICHFIPVHIILGGIPDFMCLLSLHLNIKPAYVFFYLQTHIPP